VPSAPTTVAEVIARMEAILRPLADSDGVACFTRLYLEVTEGVQARLGGIGFADPAFVADLDVRFANLYFDAVDASTRDSSKVPRAWAPLFEARSRRAVAPLQFAIAGMNAHINRDLPVAIVAGCERAGIGPAEGSPQHADFLRINDVLATVESQVKERYLTGWLHRIDRLVHRVHRLDDVVAMWDVRRARDAAWTNAEALWALRGNRDLSSRYLATLDRSVGLASRGFLTPADTWVGRLGRTLHLG